MKFWQTVTAITWKDTISEMRTKEIISSVLVFTLLVIVIFNFSFGDTQQTIKVIAPGILWVTFAFAGVLSLNRLFVPEKEQDCIEGLMVCPVSREAIYTGKMMGSFIFMLVVEAIALPVFALLFNLPVLSLQTVSITVLATLGFVVVGTLFSAMAINTKAREMVLPILFFPIISPVIISAVKATEISLAGGSWSSLVPWLPMIAAFDAIFFVACFLIFSYVIEE